MSTTGGDKWWTCHKCGGQVLEGCVHHCPSGIRLPDSGFAGLPYSEQGFAGLPDPRPLGECEHPGWDGFSLFYCKRCRKHVQLHHFVPYPQPPSPENPALELEVDLLTEQPPAPEASNVIAPVYFRLMQEVARQDEKHGRFDGATQLGKSRLALACLEDEVREAVEAWRGERKAATWEHTREEVLQVAAVAIRALRDAL